MRVIKRPLLVDRNQRLRLAWCLAGLSADYSIVIAILTSNSFEGHLCRMHADYLPSLCF
jgi:hypothetical protein